LPFPRLSCIVEKKVPGSRRLSVPTASKVYNFPMEKVENQLVSWLKRSRGASTVADMIAGTGLPKYQVEQAARRVLDEYAGRLKVTESGELLYSFPSGMHSTVRGAGPALRRFLRSFMKGAARVFSLLFKIWIVAMLVGYFVAFVLIIVAAIVASFAASMASRSDGRGGGGGRGRGGFGGMYLVIRLFDLLLRMWFWSNLLGGFQGGMQQQRRKRPDGRAFYKSVFGFVFGEGDPNAGWDEAERRYVISYIVSHKGVTTVEELMALTGRELDDANALINRLLLEFEGEPSVTEDGTVIYTFPALMRTSRLDPGASVPLLNAASKKPVTFSANKPRTTGWIVFFNAFNLAFGSYFLAVSVTQGAAAITLKGTSIYSLVGTLLQTYAGIPPVPFLEIVLGIIPVAFSICFFLVPLFRSLRLRRQNAKIREEALRKSILARILSNPAYVDPAEVPSLGASLNSRDVPSLTRKLVEKLAAAFKAEPIPKARAGEFAYRFADLERQTADLEKTRAKVDLKKYELGETVFDTGN
jgi:hypothetical protein